MLYMIAVWESDMMDTFFIFHLDWTIEPTSFKAIGEVIPYIGPAIHCYFQGVDLTPKKE